MAAREPGSSLAAGPTSRREQLMTARGWKVRPPFAVRAVRLTLQQAGGRQGPGLVQ